MKKFCVKCGKPFDAVGREVICPACKAQAAEESKRAAVLKAKRASWAGESVPVRISGRASTVIREYGAANNMPFAQALDALLQASDYFKSTGKAWEEVEPYKSRRRDKHATAGNEQDAPQGKQDTQDAPQDVQGEHVKPVKQEQGKAQEVKQAAKKAVKTTSKKRENKA